MMLHCGAPLLLNFLKGNVFLFFTQQCYGKERRNRLKPENVKLSEIANQ